MAWNNATLFHAIAPLAQFYLNATYDPRCAVPVCISQNDFLLPGNLPRIKLWPAGADFRDLIDYLVAADLMNSRPQTPLFLTAIRRTKQFRRNTMTAGDIGRMVIRRMRDAGLHNRLCPHSFRVATVTNLLEQNVPLENRQPV
jgi:hypothetical protein